MFSALSNNLTAILDKLKGKGILTAADLDVAMREIRIALLEADVAVPIVRQFIEGVKTKAIGQEVIKSVTPGNMIVKIVQDELELVLGSDDNSLKFGPAPSVIMMVGLQGSGKTTTAAKLALHIRKKLKKKVLLASLDTYRPAAQLQLESLAKQIGVDSLPIIADHTVLQIAPRALKEAQLGGFEVLILDTAGRLHTDPEMMEELQKIERLCPAHETILVVDAMTGQDALNIGREFSQQLNLTGVILTRVDGDARGGAALSMRQVTGLPIKFVGVGEKVSELEEFHPGRAASRILGMGDIISLVERASELVDKDEAQKLAMKMQRGNFNMNDLLKQLRSVQKMGGMGSILGMMPGLGKLKQMAGSLEHSNKMIKSQEAIIYSMTKAERNDPKIINASRKIRIANGSGKKVQDVNRLLKQWLEMQNMMKKIGKMDQKKMVRMFSEFN
jgi:signal recognition particle subunit SRP54